MTKVNINKILRKKKKVRSKVYGTSDMPRISVHKSSMHIYAQAIDDSKKNTIAYESDLKVKEKLQKIAKANLVGKKLAEKLVALKIKKAIFDRGQFRYLGRVKEIAEALRKNGITI